MWNATIRAGHLVVMLGIAASATPAAAEEPYGSPPGTIRVIGEASVSARPDQAELDVGVVSESETADAAATENTRKMERLVAALKKAVGPGGEVKTVGYLVTQRFTEPKKSGDRPTIVGYVVTNVVRVRIPDVRSAGRIVDLALKQGANEVQRLIFTLRNPDPVQAEALKAAAAKARARAVALAAALGLKLGNVVSVSDGAEGRPIPFHEVSRAALDSGATPLEAGSLEVQATVTVFFAVSPQ
jgi:uncharacterized protein YggE